MKNKIITFSLATIFVSSLVSCRKFVEIDLVGKRELKYTQDYQSLLNNSTSVEKSYYWPVLASDDIYGSDEAYLNTLLLTDANAYCWKSDLVGDNNEDPDWADQYQQIYLFNQVATEIMDSQGGTDAQKKNILAQAKVHRALNYFNLVNSYAKQYNASSANTDLGVPLLTSPDLYAKLDRKSVETVYEQIIEDLSSAIPDLPEQANFNILASQSAAQGILARVYLQMRDYGKALQYAELVLAKPYYKLIDLKQYKAAPNSYPNILDDTEEIFIKSLRNSFPTLSLNPDLLALFEPGDLRATLFTVDGSVFTWTPFQGKAYNKHRIISANAKITNGPTLPEMMLIKAEALARDNSRFAEAVAVLNSLRSKRFDDNAYTPLQITDQQAILKLVINERRKELMGKGLRWFDQKRLAAEPDFGTTQTRTYKGESFTLAPNSNRYVLPIASKYIVLNPEIIQNPR
ncbi:RagB/SusD family nutrient uptake outer membrane protein [Sphingobacterium sp. UBA7625]|uniref:RagB/SusD family nutrient uptake outer membrane protein n=1 Tax=Sphingobacterium sp. UBA7625 TaxID=1947522 RepID=UPI00257F910B|nr:RagB/SusD family nutrient uptake outer membrane protein [Sphingobacterium sp. UBA7625]